MPHTRFNSVAESNDANSITQMTGAPHNSYCLYFAALVLFCARPEASTSNAEIILDFRTTALALSSTKESSPRDRAMTSQAWERNGAKS
ncbi:hypothetical protein LTR01_001480 [Friedmanniomyces endolithicus]|nr:hypothetical protein LTS09_012892 [Friedmanniomyces endolithicus]KAK0314656.1 hypothetical protein LTR01_001480 [Friedmanniomyces endolithicus]KAK0830902.1 hypothetical protein LTR73_003289 [Friedmanniomyces endolithicus]